jgi:hypothetical protein
MAARPTPMRLDDLINLSDDPDCFRDGNPELLVVGVVLCGEAAAFPILQRLLSNLVAPATRSSSTPTPLRSDRCGEFWDRLLHFDLDKKRRHHIVLQREPRLMRPDVLRAARGRAANTSGSVMRLCIRCNVANWYSDLWREREEPTPNAGTRLIL